MTTMAVSPVNGRVERGCGYRQAGGVYFTTGTSAVGDVFLVEHFLLDPPILVPEHLDVPRRGVTLLEKNGVWHVLDHVGSDGYPNVADFIEEVKRFGLSRRAPKKLEWEKLSKDSRIILCHSRAWIENFRPDYRVPIHLGDEHYCPKGRPEHRNGEQGPCAGIWWEDITDGDLIAGRTTQREMPSFAYKGLRAPEGVTPVYREAFFASFPITAIEVIKDRDGDEHVKGLEATAAVHGIPVALVDV